MFWLFDWFLDGGGGLRFFVDEFLETLFHQQVSWGFYNIRGSDMFSLKRKACIYSVS